MYARVTLRRSFHPSYASTPTPKPAPIPVHMYISRISLGIARFCDTGLSDELHKVIDGKKDVCVCAYRRT